jgi:hypothetical protein
MDLIISLVFIISAICVKRQLRTQHEELLLMVNPEKYYELSTKPRPGFGNTLLIGFAILLAIFGIISTISTSAH